MLRRKQKASEIPAPRDNYNTQAILSIIIYIFVYLSIQIPGEGNENPLQYSCLENSMDRGACQATVHGVA